MQQEYRPRPRRNFSACLANLFALAACLISCTSAVLCSALANVSEDANRIQPWPQNPYYWQYQGKPILLLGGSREDNLFNHPEGLEKHLDTLAACGGNYIRNTMSSRDPGNPWAFKRLDNGLYDLNQWNSEYWQRLVHLLELCKKRGIIVQIEVWDPWDYFKTEAPLGYGPNNVGWESCPFNPALNVNYDAAESRLAEHIDYYSGAEPSDHLFFHTPPALKDIPVVRKYQEAFVSKLLSITLNYPNVLYCMNNEVGEPPEWGEYWATFIRAKAKEAGKLVCLTDMRRNHNFESAEQIHILHDRKHYDFFEISQNNSNLTNDQKHYDRIIQIRDRVAAQPIPLNNVKIYGGTIGSWTTSVEEGTRRFWRNIFGGCASVRFHRPGPKPDFFAIGLSELAQTHIRAMRSLTDAMNVFTCAPRNDLLSQRDSNEAYCLAQPGQQYAVYFPANGSVKLDLGATPGPLNLRWLEIERAAWQDSQTVKGGGLIELKVPGNGPWAVLLTPQKPQPHQTLNPPDGITPAQTREWFPWSFPQFNSPNPDEPNRYPRQTWTPEERKAYEQRIDWFHQARYGLFFHFLSGGEWTLEEWNQWVDAVDVEKVADQAKALGAGYIILTLGQNQTYACAPNPVIEKHWGPYTSKRDLPMDLYHALEKRGIPLMLYYAADNQHKMPLPEGMDDRERYKLWLEVARWYALHYGTRCKGWWVDGLTELVPGYCAAIHQALKEGNPQGIVSSGQYELSDFVHGHCQPDWERQRQYVKPYYGRWDPDFRIQWQVLQYLGPTWGAPGLDKKTEDFIEYAVDVVKGGGVITFDIGTFKDGAFYKMPSEFPKGIGANGERLGPFLEIQDDQYKLLEKVRDALKDIPASDGSKAMPRASSPF